MDIETLAVVCLLQAISLVSAWFFRERIADFFAETMQKRLVSWFSEPENQKSLAANAQNLIAIPMVESLKLAFFGQKGGLQKGINSLVRNAGEEGITAITDATMGPMIGPMVNKALEQYPDLKAALPFILPMLKGGIGQPNPSSNPSLEGKLGMK